MALTTQSEKCPFCRETIRPGATRCKHCQAEIGNKQKKRKPFFLRFDNFRFGFIVGILITLALTLFVLQQFD